MLLITTNRTESTGTTVTIEVIVTADSESPGIRRVQVLTYSRDPLETREFECDRFAHFYIENIPRIQLPVYVVVTECERPNGDIPGEEVTVAGPFLNEERDVPGLSPVICRPTVVDMPNTNNAACVEANSRVQRLRNQIRLLCEEAANLRRQRDESAAVAAAGYVAAAALAGAAAGASSIPLWGWLVALVLAIAAGIALLVALAASIAAAVFSAQLGDKLGEIRNAQREYADIVEDIQRVCCPEFIAVSLDAPGCE